MRFFSRQNIKLTSAMKSAFQEEVFAAFRANRKDSYSELMKHLERAHIISQSSAWRHFSIHFIMFLSAIAYLDFKESFAQIPRMLLAIPGSLMDRYPKGNPGRSNISMWKEVALPDDLKKLFT